MGDRVRHIARIAFACASIMVALMSPAIAHADTSSARVRLFQQYRVDVSGLPNSFSYRVTREDDAAPIPVDESGSAIDTFSLRRDDDIWLTFAFEEDVLTGTGTLLYRYKAEPVTTKLEDGLYYVDILSTDLRAGVNVYYIEVFVTVAADGTIEDVIPIVHIEGWDGPKVSDPGWCIDLDEDTYNSLLGTSGDSNHPISLSNIIPFRNWGANPYLPRGSYGGGTSNMSGTSRSSDSASGRNDGTTSGSTGATSNTGSSSTGTGANSTTNAKSGTTNTGGSNSSATTTANGTVSSGTSGSTSGTNVIGVRNVSDGLATTADPTNWTLTLALVASALLILAMGLIWRRQGRASVN